RPLLDMHLEIAQQILRAQRQRRNGSRIESGLAHDIGDAAAAIVAPLQHVHVEAAGDRAAAHIGRGKAHALLFGEADHIEMEGQPPPSVVKMLRHDRVREDSERAVVAAAIDDGVVVRGDDQCPRVRIGGAVAADDVAHPVDLGRHAGGGHQRLELGGDRAMGRREIGAGQPVGRFRPLRQPRRQLDDAPAERPLLGYFTLPCSHSSALIGRRRSCNARCASVILPTAGRATQRPGAERASKGAIVEAVLTEWLSLVVRWLHVIAGIAWIGSSFYFIHLDLSLKHRPDLPAGVRGDAWQVHGGGFYHMVKYLVAPARMPDELTWFKWEAYTTWLSGFALLVIVYYLGAELYLIDRSVLELTAPAAAAIAFGSLVLAWLFYEALCRSPLGRHEMALALTGYVVLVALTYGFTRVFRGGRAFTQIGALIGTITVANVFGI